MFDVFQKIKIEKSIVKIGNEVENEDIIRNRERIRRLFEKVLEPELIELNDKKVCISYDFEEKSKLNNKIKEIEMWEEDNVVTVYADRSVQSALSGRHIQEETTLVPVNLQSWLDLTNTPEHVQKEIVKKMENDLNGGTPTGFYPYIKDGQIWFDHRWLFLIGIKK